MFEFAGLIFSSVIGSNLHSFGRKNMIILGYVVMVSFWIGFHKIKF
jgi:hypothetical protein